jgi:predicted GIY-YIG superfamily endonuclease
MKKWFVYILQCKDGSFYTGVTPNLKRRIQEHKEGRGGRYTLLHKPLKIVFSERFYTKTEALKREKQIKGWSHKKKENLIKFGKP